MLFSSTVFLLGFLPALLFCYFIIPAGRDGRGMPAKNLVLLAFSLGFYAWGGVRYLAILIASILINYLGGLFVTRPRSGKMQKLLLIITVILDLGILGVFKYAGFAASAAASLGIPVIIPDIALPIGISFFTFQGMSYVIDVYRRDASVQKNPLYVALYISLFPQLVAGPIVRYTTVENEIASRSHSVELFSQGAVRFMLGFGKKMLLANTMGQIADEVFAFEAGLLSTPAAWVGAIAYTFQIYFDFSAYSDMAIGLGKMFGFHFLENFNYPYIASSVTDFWRRWHISLSTWFRDYVYIPLGGSRRSLPRSILNLLIVWALTGLWHGASWTFVAWGAFFGVLLILEKYVFAGVPEKMPKPVRHIVTLLLIIISWVLFRSDTIGGAIRYIGVMFGVGGGVNPGYTEYCLREFYPELILCLIAVFPVKGVLEKYIAEHSDNRLVFLFGELAPKAFGFIVFILGYFKLVSGSFNPFIYFQF